MPRDLFGDVTSPSITLGTRKWYSVPLSFLIHTLALGLLIVVPLLASGVLPMPDDPGTIVHIESPPLPQPPPVRTVKPQTAARPEVAPVVEPAVIPEEPALDRDFEATGAADPLVGAGTIEGAAIVAPPPPAIEPPPAPTKPIRPGGQIRPPERVTYVSPVYSPIALTARVQGLVIVEAIIDNEGRVQDARVLRTDSPLLNESALTAVRQWTYKPTLLNGVPVSVVMTVTVQFKLQ